MAYYKCVVERLEKDVRDKLVELKQAEPPPGAGILATKTKLGIAYHYYTRKAPSIAMRSAINRYEALRMFMHHSYNLYKNVIEDFNCITPITNEPHYPYIGTFDSETGVVILNRELVYYSDRPVVYTCDPVLFYCPGQKFKLSIIHPLLNRERAQKYNEPDKLGNGNKFITNFLEIAEQDLDSPAADNGNASDTEMEDMDDDDEDDENGSKRQNRFLTGTVKKKQTNRNFNVV